LSHRQFYLEPLGGSLAVARETSPGKYQIVQNLKTRPGAKTMAIDSTTHTVFLPTAEFGKQIPANIDAKTLDAQFTRDGGEIVSPP
jgi:hypothetical protein